MVGFCVHHIRLSQWPPLNLKPLQIKLSLLLQNSLAGGGWTRGPKIRPRGSTVQLHSCRQKWETRGLSGARARLVSFKSMSRACETNLAKARIRTIDAHVHTSRSEAHTHAYLWTNIFALALTKLRLRACPCIFAPSLSRTQRLRFANVLRLFSPPHTLKTSCRWSMGIVFIFVAPKATAGYSCWRCKFATSLHRLMLKLSFITIAILEGWRGCSVKNCDLTCM